MPFARRPSLILCVVPELCNLVTSDLQPTRCSTLVSLFSHLKLSYKNFATTVSNYPAFSNFNSSIMACQEQESGQLACIVDDFSHRSALTRRKAINKLSDWLSEQNDVQTITNAFKSQWAVPLTKLVTDRSESIREQALQLLIQLSPLSLPSLFYLFSIKKNRKRREDF